MRVALVTGSGKRRLGSHVAEALAARGYAVGLHYYHSAQEAEAFRDRLAERGAQVLLVHADIAQAADAHRLVDTITAHFGRLDVLVNCAAIWQPALLEQTVADDVHRHWAVNTLGTFLCSQRAGLTMVRQSEGGSIITFGDWAVTRPYPNYAAYFASKGAIPALTRSLAIELGSRNPAVRVNCILPGPVLLPPDLPVAEREQAIAATLLKREGRPENVVQAVLFLIDNDFVTGVSLPVDGGRSIYATGM